MEGNGTKVVNYCLYHDVFLLSGEIPCEIYLTKF